MCTFRHIGLFYVHCTNITYLKLETFNFVILKRNRIIKLIEIDLNLRGISSRWFGQAGGKGTQKIKSFPEFKIG